MDSGEALRIFDNIESPKYTKQEKGEAIYIVLNFPTHNSITKQDLLRVMRWMWGELFERPKEGNSHV